MTANLFWNSTTLLDSVHTPSTGLDIVLIANWSANLLTNQRMWRPQPRKDQTNIKKQLAVLIHENQGKREVVVVQKKSLQL